jgi:hypothetical protein
MPASLTAIRDSGDSKRGNFLEKSFRSAINSGDPRPGKQREGLPAGTYQEINPSKENPRGKDQGRERIGKGINGLELIPWEPIAPSPVNILNNPLVASLSAFLSSAIHLGKPFKVLSRFAKNSIITAV